MRLSLAFAILVSSISSPVIFGDDKEKKDTFEYTLEVGMKWTFKARGMENPLIMVAEKEKKVGTKTGIEVVAIVNGAPALTEVMMIEKGKLYRLDFQGNEVDPPLELLAFDAKKGAEWSGKFTMQGMNVTSDFSLKIEDVTVPLATYKDCRVVVANAEVDNNKVVSTVWYAKGVGMVKQTISVNGMEIALLELTKFEKPKK